MNRFLLLYLATILAGFAIIRVPLDGILEPFAPVTLLVGVLTVLTFSCVIIFNGFMALFGKRTKL
ncbi:hypothetical protein [Texcoconibacillus texcoconensis]|uniref:Uncharacterized protein n=1 Tax=Texcoconibacillus texcoconensis TaxID=1095777 RepID=A0A840QR84_9BACI|nr:hypothetical protein [Texcoconibacillus texcoconensis]MBB5173860.1 hypothetical protein [Texcoconibacillus texcoconensis]